MPELPEVQTVVNNLIAQKLKGVKIIQAQVFWPKTIDGSVPSFCKQIADQTILQIERKGKFICLILNSYTLLIHLRMSGKFLLNKVAKHERVHLHLEDGRILKFIDPRKFGRLYLLKDPQVKLDQLGVDPTTANFTLEHFTALLKKKKKIKTLLLDQTIIAGIGNIYADEALWLAKIHPETLACDVTPIRELHKAIKTVLQTAIERHGTSLGSSDSNFHNLEQKWGQNVTNVYQRQNLPCHRCDHQISKIRLNGRGTHFCPNCQKTTR